MKRKQNTQAENQQQNSMDRDSWENRGIFMSRFAFFTTGKENKI